MRLPVWLRGRRLDAEPTYELTDADRALVAKMVQEKITEEIDGWAALTSKTKILLRLIDHADEAAAAFSLGQYAIAFEALTRYHALRCEHAETIDIRLID